MGSRHSDLSEEVLYRQVLELGTRVFEWLGLFGREQMTLEELEKRLENVGAEEILAQNWGWLTEKPSHVPCLEVLQLLSSLEKEFHYQVSKYGFTSLFDDYKELESALAKLRQSATSYKEDADMSKLD